MIRIPIFDEIRAKDSTVYSFTTNNQDLTRLISDAGSQTSVPSKFVCLKLPKWADVPDGERQLFLDPAQFGTTPLITDPNQLVPALLQNYVENLVGYSFLDDNTTFDLTEIAFWKMLSRVGALSLDEQNGKLVDTLPDDLIQYIGDINILNHLKYKGQEYTELYMHIPHDARKVVNPTWEISNSIQGFNKLPLSESGEEFALGLENDVNTINRAIYEELAGGGFTSFYDFAQSVDRAKLDFNDYGSINEDFEFNAILIYYDVITTNSQGNRTTRRKLGQILFVRNFQQIPGTSEFEIPTVKKFRSLAGKTGNSIAYRINSKHFYGTNNVNEQVVVNQYNTISMDLYMDVLQKMLDLSNVYTEDRKLLTRLNERLASIDSFVGTQLSYDQLIDRLNTLEGELRRLSSNDPSTLNVSTTELLAAFDVLTQQITGNQPSINNTFQFSGDTANFNDNYFARDNANQLFVKYANTSFNEVLSYLNFISTVTEFRTTDDAGELQLQLLPEDDSVIRARRGATGLNLTASLTLLTDYREAGELPYHVLWCYNAETSQLELRNVSALLEADYEVIAQLIPIASFILPTETEFLDRGIQGLYLFTGNKPLRIDTRMIGKGTNGQVITYSQASLLERLKLHPMQLVTQGLVLTSYDQLNEELTIQVSPRSGDSLRYQLADGSTLTLSSKALVLNVAPDVSGNERLIIEMKLNPAQDDVVLRARPLIDVQEFGLYDEQAAPLFLMIRPTALQIEALSAVELVKIAKIRYLNIEPVSADGNIDVTNEILGPPTDGTYTDGAIDFLGKTVGDSFDEIGKLLAGIVPPSPPNLQGIQIINQGVNGNLSFDSVNPIAGASYVGADTAANNPIPVDQIFSAALTRGGIYGSGLIQGRTNPSVVNQDAFIDYAVKDAQRGTLELLLNGQLVDQIDLVSSTAAIDNTAGGSTTGLNVSQVRNVIFPSTGQPFSVQYRTIAYTIDINHPEINQGYNTVEILHIVDGLPRSSGIADFVYDDNAQAISFDNAVVTVGTLTGTRYLSGIAYRTGGNLNLSVDIANVYRNTYRSTNALSIAGAAIQNQTSSIANSNGDSAQVLQLANQSLAIATSNLSLINAAATFQIVVNATVRGNVSSPTFASQNLLLDNLLQPSNSLNEYFRDENYRVPSNFNFDNPGIISTGLWDGEQSLIDGTMPYRDQMQMIAGNLIYPGKNPTLPIDFRSSAIAQSHPNNDLIQKGNPRNYAVSTGNRFFMRWFRQVSPTTGNFRIRINGDSTVQFVPVTSGFTAKNMKVEIKLPGETGWMDGYRNFATGQTVDGSGARAINAGAGGINQFLGLTVGTKNTANSQGYVWIRLSVGPNFDAKITSINFEFS